MNADSVADGYQPSTKLSTSAVLIYHYYLARKLVSILLSNGGWKAEPTWHSSMSAAHAQGYISQWVSCPRLDFMLGSMTL